MGEFVDRGDGFFSALGSSDVEIGRDDGDKVLVIAAKILQALQQGCDTLLFLRHVFVERQEIAVDVIIDQAEALGHPFGQFRFKSIFPFGQAFIELLDEAPLTHKQNATRQKKADPGQQAACNVKKQTMGDGQQKGPEGCQGTAAHQRWRQVVGVFNGILSKMVLHDGFCHFGPHGGNDLLPAAVDLQKQIVFAQPVSLDVIEFIQQIFEQLVQSFQKMVGALLGQGFHFGFEGTFEFALNVPQPVFDGGLSAECGANGLLE